MSHLIENMFSVKETPWHGLGTILQNAPTIDEALKLAGLDWLVNKVKLHLPDGTPTEYFATQRSSDGKVLGYVGDRYHVTQNIEAFDRFRPFIENGILSLETAGSIMEGQRVWILARINPVQSADVVPGDEVKPYVLLYHSHDGTLKHHFGITPVRTVCYNTLSAALVNGKSELFAVKHTKNAKAKLDSIADMINFAKGQFEATIEQYKALANKQINAKQLEQYVRIVYNLKPEGQEQRESSVLKEVTELFSTGKGNSMPGVKGTAWAAYNAVTEHLTWNRGRDADTRINSLWFGQGVDLNAKAKDEALKLVAA
jgi:phage/plasmid-like protein (TIGR03299 family)